MAPLFLGPGVANYAAVSEALQEKLDEALVHYARTNDPTPARRYIEAQKEHRQRWLADVGATRDRAALVAATRFPPVDAPVPHLPDGMVCRLCARALDGYVYACPNYAYHRTCVLVTAEARLVSPDDGTTDSCPCGCDSSFFRGLVGGKIG